MYKYMFTYPGQSFHFSACIYKFKQAELIFGGIVRPMLFQRQSARCLHLGNYFFKHTSIENKSCACSDSFNLFTAIDSLNAFYRCSEIQNLHHTDDSNLTFYLHHKILNDSRCQGNI